MEREIKLQKKQMVCKILDQRVMKTKEMLEEITGAMVLIDLINKNNGNLIECNPKVIIDQLRKFSHGFTVDCLFIEVIKTLRVSKRNMKAEIRNLRE